MTGLIVLFYFVGATSILWAPLFLGWCALKSYRWARSYESPEDHLAWFGTLLRFLVPLSVVVLALGGFLLALAWLLHPDKY